MFEDCAFMGITEDLSLRYSLLEIREKAGYIGVFAKASKQKLSGRTSNITAS